MQSDAPADAAVTRVRLHPAPMQPTRSLIPMPSTFTCWLERWPCFSTVAKHLRSGGAVGMGIADYAEIYLLLLMTTSDSFIGRG